MAEFEAAFEIRAKKYYHKGTDQSCGLVMISGWSEFIRENRMIFFSVLDDNNYSKLSWTFLVDSSLKKLRNSKRMQIKIPRSSVKNLICVTAKLVVDVSEVEQSPFMLRHFRVVSESSENATLEEEDDSFRRKFLDMDISQFFDVRPRLQSAIGVKDEDGPMLTFIEKNAHLPAERSREFRTAESSVPFEIYQGNSRTASDNRHLRDLELLHESQDSTRYSWLSLEVRGDGTVTGREGESCRVNQKSSRCVKAADVFSSSEPIYAHSPQVDVDLPSNTVTLTVKEKSTVVNNWKLTITNVLYPKGPHVFLVTAELPKQEIPLPPGVLVADVRYKLIVKGLQDIDAKDHPGTTFKVVCETETDVVQLHLVRKAFNKVAVQIPRPLTSTIAEWKVTLETLTNSRNLPHDNAPKCYFTTKESGKPFRLPLHLQAGCTYKVKLRGYPDGGCTCKGKAKRKKSRGCTCQKGSPEDFEVQTTFRAELTNREVETLYEKALDYIDQETHAPCRWLYRNQPLEYFEEILAKGGIMKTYEKDTDGDPASPINHILKGLSFTASVRTGSKSGQPIPVSPFGNTRLLVPAHELLDKAPNMYFADIYCHMGPRGHIVQMGQRHHVMLVLTKPDSEADKFCETRILKLNITDNPFLFRDSSGNVQVSTSDNLMVHVFYTDDLDINGYDLERNIKQVGTGSGNPGGIPKNRSCGTCNLDHAIKVKSDDPCVLYIRPGYQWAWPEKK